MVCALRPLGARTNHAKPLRGAGSQVKQMFSVRASREQLHLVVARAILGAGLIAFE